MLKKMDVRVSKWNVRNLYTAGSLMTVAKEILNYKLDLVRLQEVRSERVGTEPVGEYTFFYGKGNKNNELCKGFLLA
jgi:hypothetical protein